MWATCHSHRQPVGSVAPKRHVRTYLRKHTLSKGANHSSSPWCVTYVHHPVVQRVRSKYYCSSCWGKKKQLQQYQLFVYGGYNPVVRTIYPPCPRTYVYPTVVTVNTEN